MYKNYLKNISKFSAVAVLPVALALTGCVEDKLSIEGNSPEQGNPNTPSEQVNPLSRVAMSTSASDQNRVEYSEISRAGNELEPGELKLVANIKNPNSEIFSGSTGSRLMSATSIYYDDKNDTYYTTYHVQGNNYGTNLDVSTSGAIETFKVNDSDVTLDKVYKAASTALSFDFNHIYFDNTDNRIIVVGHNQKPGNENTQAIIGLFDTFNNTLDYKSVTTAEKAYDADGKSLGNKDAGDANCVIRANDAISVFDGKAYGYPQYYLATRKGIAVVSAKEEDLFSPILNEDGANYFVPTPGSTKYVFNNPEVGSGMDFLYLSEEHSASSYGASSKANLATFQVATGRDNVLLGFITPNSPWTTYYDSKDLDILNYEQQIELPEAISPVDGKNAMCALSYSEYYVPLGTNGLFYKFRGANTYQNHEGVLKFDNRPVNAVVADRSEMESGHDGFIYIANGRRLTIIHRGTFEEVASYSVPVKDGEDNEVAASANFIHVRKAPANGDWSPRERIITVAFGQEGVKIFRFKPTTGKTVWELPSY